MRKLHWFCSDKGLSGHPECHAMIRGWFLEGGLEGTWLCNCESEQFEAIMRCWEVGEGERFG